jgi:hypothetical protein
VCVAKVLAVLDVFALIGYALIDLWHDHFALSDFGNRLRTVLLGSAGLVASKQMTQKLCRCEPVHT